jgi:predicted nucleic acid-binding Zn ribbon protein
MLKPMVAKPLFSSERVLSVNDVYSELGGHLLWRRLQETQKVLQRRGVGMGMLDNENLCTELVSQYLTLKKRQVL